MLELATKLLPPTLTTDEVEAEIEPPNVSRGGVYLGDGGSGFRQVDEFTGTVATVARTGDVQAWRDDPVVDVVNAVRKGHSTRMPTQVDLNRNNMQHTAARGAKRVANDVLYNGLNPVRVSLAVPEAAARRMLHPTNHPIRGVARAVARADMSKCSIAPRHTATLAVGAHPLEAAGAGMRRGGGREVEHAEAATLRPGATPQRDHGVDRVAMTGEGMAGLEATAVRRGPERPGPNSTVRGPVGPAHAGPVASARRGQISLSPEAPPAAQERFARRTRIRPATRVRGRLPLGSVDAVDASSAALVPRIFHAITAAAASLVLGSQDAQAAPIPSARFLAERAERCVGGASETPRRHQPLLPMVPMANLIQFWIGPTRQAPARPVLRDAYRAPDAGPKARPAEQQVRGARGGVARDLRPDRVEVGATTRGKRGSATVGSRPSALVLAAERTRDAFDSGRGRVFGILAALLPKMRPDRAPSTTHRALDWARGRGLLSPHVPECAQHAKMTRDAPDDSVNASHPPLSTGVSAPRLNAGIAQSRVDEMSMQLSQAAIR